MNRQSLAITLASGFFVVLFAFATVLNIIQGDYIQAAGFLLLGISNIPFLLSNWDERMASPVVDRLTKATVVAGLLLVFSGLLL